MSYSGTIHHENGILSLQYLAPKR